VVSREFPERRPESSRTSPNPCLARRHRTTRRRGEHGEAGETPALRGVSGPKTATQFGQCGARDVARREARLRQAMATKRPGRECGAAALGCGRTRCSVVAGSGPARGTGFGSSIVAGRGRPAYIRCRCASIYVVGPWLRWQDRIRIVHRGRPRAAGLHPSPIGRGMVGDCRSRTADSSRGSLPVNPQPAAPEPGPGLPACRRRWRSAA